VKSAKVKTLSPLKIRPTRRTRRRYRSVFSCGPGSAVLDCPTFPLLTIHRLAWRLVSLRRQGGCTMWRANMSPKS
jgi:hypothetical protein